MPQIGFHTPDGPEINLEQAMPDDAAEDARLELRIYEGDSAFVVRENGNKSLYRDKLISGLESSLAAEKQKLFDNAEWAASLNSRVMTLEAEQPTVHSCAGDGSPEVVEYLGKFFDRRETLDTQTGLLAAEKRRREDAEHDAVRLHSEKMDAIDARLAAEQRVAALEQHAKGLEGVIAVRSANEIDALHAAEQRVAALEADRARLMSNPQAERYWEARWRDEAARVAALEGALTLIPDWFIRDFMASRSWTAARIMDVRSRKDGQEQYLEGDWLKQFVPAVAALRPAETGDGQP